MLLFAAVFLIYFLLFSGYRRRDHSGKLLVLVSSLCSEEASGAGSRRSLSSAGQIERQCNGTGRWLSDLLPDLDLQASRPPSEAEIKLTVHFVGIQPRLDHHTHFPRSLK